MRAVMAAIFGLSGDAFWESVYRAFQLGWIDLPFSPHADNANRLVTMRDADRPFLGVMLMLGFLVCIIVKFQ